MKRLGFLSCVVAASLAIFGASAGSAADDTIKRVKSSGQLRACFADDNPWAFKNPGSNKWEGLLPEMAAGLADTMGVKLVEVDGNWSSIIQSLQADQCDMITAPLFATVKRAEQVIFSHPYAYEYTTIYVNTSSSFKTYEEFDVAGNTVAVRAGTAPADFASRFFKNAKPKTYLSDTSLTVLTDLASKRVDGWLDSVIATGRFLAQNPQYPVRAIGDAPLEPVELVWALKAGDYQFQQLVNTFIFSYRSSGKMSAAWTKWFGTKFEMPRL